MNLSSVQCTGIQSFEPAAKKGSGMYQRHRVVFDAPNTPVDGQQTTYFNWDYPQGVTPAVGNIYAVTVVEDSYKGVAGWKVTALSLVTAQTAMEQRQQGAPQLPAPVSYPGSKSRPPAPKIPPEDARLGSMCLAYAKDVLVAALGAGGDMTHLVANIDGVTSSVVMVELVEYLTTEFYRIAHEVVKLKTVSSNPEVVSSEPELMSLGSGVNVPPGAADDIPNDDIPF